MPLRSAVHIPEEELELYVRGCLKLRRTPTVEHHLLKCRTCREQLSQSIGSQIGLHIGKTKTQEGYQRSEPRFSTGDHAILQELSPLEP
jgi:hypothetical protein